MPAKPYLHHAHVAAGRVGEQPQAGILEEAEEEERFVHWLNVSQEVAQDHKDASGWEEPAPGPFKRLTGRLRRGSATPADDTFGGGNGALAAIAQLPPRGLPARIERPQREATQEADEPREVGWATHRR